MKIHVLKHTGERPHKCDQCPAAFTQGAHLKKHYLRHIVNRKFQCIYCRFFTNNRAELKKHTSTHSYKTGGCESVESYEHSESLRPAKLTKKSGLYELQCKKTVKSPFVS
uniref:C2H2-type domain-containing protein n=2 Tax=Graphocephala atropunctata TaxID=36148 RepID=A0A1B6M9D9_9HEMI